MSINASQHFLVSVGIPVYNRPEGLQRTLECITNQTYKNLEIIVSDNCSSNPEVENVAREFAEKDPRIIYYCQPKNRGAAFNFNFVLGQASGKYFMWSSDDDILNSNDYIEVLLSNLLTNNELLMIFPEVNLIDAVTRKEIKLAILHEVFGSCETDEDYFWKWCTYQKGYPIYGLYALKNVQRNEIDLKMLNLWHHNEGLNLHQLFFRGGVRFVKEVAYNYSVHASRHDSLSFHVKGFLSYLCYSCCVLFFYSTSKMPWNKRKSIFKTVFPFHWNASRKSFNAIKRNILKLYLNPVKSD